MPHHAESGDIQTMWSDIVSGSSAAWGTLVRLLAPVVLAVIRRYQIEAADIEDISQQTWLALWSQRRRITNPGALPAWLIRVASRKAARLREQQRRTRDVPTEHFIDPVPLPDEELQALERLGQLHLALHNLDPRCRQLLTHLFLDDPRMSYAEIAREIQLNPNSLGPIRERCLKKLRQIYDDLGDNSTKS